MSEITRIGIDLAKNVIQVHAVGGAGKVITSRALSRDKFMPLCAQLPAGALIAMEASSSAHHWARKLVTLGLDDWREDVREHVEENPNYLDGIHPGLRTAVSEVIAEGDEKQ